MSENNKFSKVENFIDDSVSKKQIPGVALSVVTLEDTKPYFYYAGYSHFNNKVPVSEQTVFDLASLTKVVATLPSFLKLLEEGLLDLDDPVSYYVPEFSSRSNKLTIKHLLTHTSGYQPEIKFYKNDSSLEEAVALIANLKNNYLPGNKVIYSDLNFITLGYIIEKISKMTLDRFTQENIFYPLEMFDTSFNPKGININRFASTEFRESINDFQWGTVHDENAENFGGVCGHAGLFSTVKDLSNFCKMILNDGYYNKIRFLSPRTVKLSANNFTQNLNLNRGLGWQLYDTPSISGQYMQNGFGHTGFTGTSLWFSPDHSYAIILLTNRVHFGRQNNINRFRRIVHNLVSLEM